MEYQIFRTGYQCGTNIYAETWLHGSRPETLCLEEGTARAEEPSASAFVVADNSRREPFWPLRGTDGWGLSPSCVVRKRLGRVSTARTQTVNGTSILLSLVSSRERSGDYVRPD